MIKVVVLLLCVLYTLAQHEHHDAHAGMKHFTLNVRTTGDVCGTSSTSKSVAVTLSTVSGVEYKTIVSNGCPGYDWTSVKNPGQPLEYENTFKFRTSPVLNTNPTMVGVKQYRNNTGSNLTGVGGAIGIAINGVAIFSNADSQSRDAYVYESVSFDNCRGHHQQQGVYHYHSEPGTNCVTTDVAGQHSKLVGYMYDGIPIFGPKGDAGVVPTDLDECSGHVDTTYPFYHYHMANNITYPYVVNCLKGCIYTAVAGTPLANAATTCVPQATQYDYSSMRYTLVTSNDTTSPTPTTAATTTRAPTPTPTTITPTRAIQGASTYTLSVLSLLIALICMQA